MRAGLCGEGNALGRRARLLVDAGLKARLLPVDFDDGQLDGLSVLFVAGLDIQGSHAIAARARARRVLVNVEDEPDLCDFRVPAIVRRGDLLLTVSTGGHSPGLSRRLREWLETQFGKEWESRLAQLSDERARWRADGIAPSDVSLRTSELISREGWLR